MKIAATMCVIAHLVFAYFFMDGLAICTFTGSEEYYIYRAPTTTEWARVAVFLSFDFTEFLLCVILHQKEFRRYTLFVDGYTRSLWEGKGWHGPRFWLMISGVMVYALINAINGAW